jgi:hypothetical protein
MNFKIQKIFNLLKKGKKGFYRFAYSAARKVDSMAYLGKTWDFCHSQKISCEAQNA